jgi:general secretion pathway protein A
MYANTCTRLRTERPFAITPNPRFVYLSQRHQDAWPICCMASGSGGSGGFVQLTGEVGTGKTTLCRLVLEQVPEHTRIALILNPMLSPPELLRAICVELEIDLKGAGKSMQKLQDRLNRFLLDRHADGERVVLIIDEAQNMSREALEQVRLLTNLETATDKLLQIILLGQPELRLLLARPELRQLAQRITARYHLDPLNRSETEYYVRHRLAVAGAERCPFTSDGLKALYKRADGVPRLINIIADRALMAGYAHEMERIGARVVREAAREVAGDDWDEGTGWLRGAVAASSWSPWS